MSRWEPYLRRMAKAGFDLSPPYDSVSTHLEAYTDEAAFLAAGHELRALATNAAGDEYLVWRYPGLEGTPPVVFLGDGTLEVVAGSEDDFYRLLAAERLVVADSDDEEKALQALAKEVEAQLGPLSDRADVVQQRARAQHPDFAAALAKHDAPTGPIEPLWMSWPDAELVDSVVPYRNGDLRKALDLAMAKVHEGTGSGALWTIARIAMEAGDLALAEQLYERTGRAQQARQARVAQGRTAEVVAELEGVLRDPATAVDELVPLLGELEDLAPDRCPALALEVERVRRPGDALQPPLVRTLPPRRLRDLAQSRAKRVELQWWALARAELALVVAQASLELGEVDAATAALDAMPDLPDVADAATALRQAIEAYQPAAPTSRDEPLAELFDAWKEGSGGGAAAARLGLALVEAGRRAEAWSPLEDAAMNLSASHELTAQVFALIDELDAEGLSS